jgi:signal transduction histidine kinase/ligand-binding sensor domain-containing protein
MRLVKVLLLILLLIRTAVFAQTYGDPSLVTSEQYLVRQYNSENGLPQNSVKDLLLDKNNFLWISTENGLVRFDGQRFRIYNTSNVPGLRSNRFDVLSATAGQQIHLTTAFDNAEIFTITPEYKIVLDTSATLLPHKFISHYSNGIFDCTSLFHGGAVDTALLQDLCRSAFFWTMNEHEIVIRYSNDLYYLNNQTEEVVKLPVGLKRSNTEACFINNIFFFRDDQGKARFFKQGRETDIKVDSSVSDRWRVFESSPPPDFFMGAKGDQAIMRDHSDIYELTIENNVLKANLLFGDLRFLDNIPVYSFQYDKKWRRLFVGTQNAGLYVISPRTFRVLTFVTQDYSDNIFMASQILPGGRLITSNGILDEKDTGRSILFANEDKPNRNCLYRAPDHSIWLSKRNHLLIYDSNFSVVKYRDSMDLGSEIKCIAEDHTGVIWVASASSLLKMEEGKLHPELVRYPAFIRHSIESCMEVSPGELWIATRNGMYAYDIATNRIRDNPILPHVYVRHIFKAKDNSIWIGTYGDGFFKYVGGHFIPLPLDPQKYLATAHAFLEDDQGFFWISTNHGLFKIRKEDLDKAADGNTQHYYYYYYDKLSGFNTNEFNGGCNPAALQDKGNFYFPSLNGIVYFRPDSIRSDLPDNPIFIDRVAVDSVNSGDNGTIRIDPDFNHLMVDISTPFYGLEDNLRLEYKLDPMDDNWSVVDRNGKLVINRLLAGKYTLRIRKMNGWSPDDVSYASVSFEVLPHWYNTKAFMALLIVLLASLILILLRLRTQFLRRQNFRLQMKVEDRTLELEQSTLLKEKLISVIMHDLRSPLFSQSLLINHLDEKFDALDKTEVREILGYLKESSNKMRQFSTDFLTWYNSQKHGFQIGNGPIELDKFIRETGAFYADIARRKGIFIDYAIPQGLIIFSDRNILSIILRNLVDNAVKYTPQGNIRITAERMDEQIRIRIDDTGSGMTADKIVELLSYMEESADKTTATFGYRFITELVRKLGGILSIESEPGKGTMVMVTLRA